MRTRRCGKYEPGFDSHSSAYSTAGLDTTLQPAALLEVHSVHFVLLSLFVKSSYILGTSVQSTYGQDINIKERSITLCKNVFLREGSSFKVDR